MSNHLTGPLRRQLLLAFLLVAFVSVVVVAAAALIGVGYGFTAAEQSTRDQTARSAATAAADAYRSAAGWAAADLTRATDVVDAAGARLVVLDTTGAVVSSASPRGPGAPTGAGHGATGRPDAGQGAASAAVVVDGTQVGTVRVLFGSPAATRGRDVAWTWIAAGAVVTLAVATGVGWVVARGLVRPVTTVTQAARALAAGDGTARSGLGGTGEIAELGAAFDAMADSLADAQQRQRTLTADVAHELRTPLAALQAGLEELRDGLVEPDPAALAGLHDQSLRLARIVDDLAELSAAESAGAPREPEVVDLAALAQEAVTARLPELRTAGLTVGTDLQPQVLVAADPGRVHQALGNVLANTARYCRPGDHVDVRVVGRGPNAVVEVRDSGPGIPAEELPHVLERLWRGRSGRAVAGSGIGLAVTRQIVQAHGGTVTVTSPATGGTTVVLSFPRREG